MAELLIPVSSGEEIRAAVKNGADAVLFDGGAITGRNSDFIMSALRYCWKNGVRGYFALKAPANDRDELRFAEEVTRLAAAGADALVLSSVGSAEIAHKIVPDMRLFAGAELAVTSIDGMEELKKLGFERAYAAKELNKYQIAHLKKYGSLPLMVTLQDEMCMSYDGQCHAVVKNGGKCDEFCRKVFSFSGTGRRRSEFPLSLKDICLAAHVREMLMDGVDVLVVGKSFCEGEEATANITKTYARIVAEERYAAAGELRELTRSAKHGGFTDAFYEGKPGPDMQGRPESSEYGALPIFDTAPTMEELPATLSRRRKVDLYFVARSSEKMMMAAVDAVGNKTMVVGGIPTEGMTDAKTADSVKLRLTGVRSDRWRVDRAMVHIAGDIDVDPNEVERMKDKCLEALEKKRYQPTEHQIMKYRAPLAEGGYEGKPRLILSYHRLEQIDQTALAASPQFIYLPIDEILTGLDLVDNLLGCGVRVAAVLPKVITDNEIERLTEKLDRIKSLGIEYAVVSNLTGLAAAKNAGLNVRGDYALNVRTSADMRSYADMGLESATAMFDLTFKDIAALSKPIDTELIAYGRLPLMLTENCISRNHYGVCDRCETQRTIVGRDGEMYPILGEPGCRNLLLDSKKLYLADRQSDLSRVGVRYIRLEFTTENRSECGDVIRSYLEKKSASSLQRPWRGAYYGA